MHALGPWCCGASPFVGVLAHLLLSTPSSADNAGETANGLAVQQSECLPEALLGDAQDL